jgi:hypothetical protein
MLRDLAKLENRPKHLTKITYEWCSAICENRERLGDWESLLLVCLEIGFRHLSPQHRFTEVTLVHTEHHRWLIDVAFKSQESEVIADLLHAWTTGGRSHAPARESLSLCVGHLVGLHDLVPFSPRLWRLVIRSIEVIGYKGFEGVGVERLIGLLNHLHVTDEDVDNRMNWAELLLDTIQFSEGTQRLSHWYWEFLVELTSSGSLFLNLDLNLTRGMQTITSLTKAKEWGKLECWMGIIWMLWPQAWACGMTEEDLDRSTLLLFHQRPGAIQKLKQWVEQWIQMHPECFIPRSFWQICERAHEAAQQDAP